MRCPSEQQHQPNHMNNTTTSSTHLDLVRQVLAEILDVQPDQVRLDSAIEADLGADSLDIVEIGMRLEESLDVAIPDDEWTGTTTVQDLLLLLEKITASP